MERSTELIAKVCHQANKALCEANGDNSQKDWEKAEEWQRGSAMVGVLFRINNPNAGHDAQHNAWMKEKVDNGWVYGKTKNAEAKTHPAILPFDQLPAWQQQKDALFCAIVDALTGKIQNSGNLASLNKIKGFLTDKYKEIIEIINEEMK